MPVLFLVPYFFGYKTSFFPFSFQNNPKLLDLSCKMDLELWHCLGRVELVLKQNFIGLIKLFEVILEGRKPRLITGKKKVMADGGYLGMPNCKIKLTSCKNHCDIKLV